MSAQSEMNRVTVATLRKYKRAGEKFTCLTAYDASFAALLDEAGVDVLLAGDSLGMVVQGHETTVPVTLEDMIYHTRLVSQATRHALVMADLPFMTYATPQQALDSAARLMREGGAQMVKLEATGPALDVAAELAAHSIPVCAHLGLSPQAVHKLGGYRVQGRSEAAAAAMVRDAQAMEAAGADVLLIECVPSSLAATITAQVKIPVIGIGAGPATDAQVLVLYDMLGLTRGQAPRFSRDFLTGTSGGIMAAVKAYIQAVKSGEFPGPEHGFE